MAAYTVKRGLQDFVDSFPSNTIPSEFFQIHSEYTDKLIEYVYELREFEQEELYLENLASTGGSYSIPQPLMTKFQDLFVSEEWESVELIISQYWQDLCVQQEQNLGKVTVLMMRKLCYMVENLYELVN